MGHRVPGALGPLRILSAADHYTWSAAATVALPVDSSGKTARYVHFSCAQDAGAFRLTNDVADATVATNMMNVPANTRLVLDCQGYSYLRYDRGVGASGTPEINICPLEVG